MKWISVKKRLPENGQQVLAVIDGGERDVVTFDGLVFFTKIHFGKLLKNVTHWMPLPEPPKEE